MKKSILILGVFALLSCKKQQPAAPAPAPTTQANPNQKYEYHYTQVGSDGVIRNLVTCCDDANADWGKNQAGWYNVYKNGPC